MWHRHYPVELTRMRQQASHRLKLAMSDGRRRVSERHSLLDMLHHRKMSVEVDTPIVQSRCKNLGMGRFLVESLDKESVPKLESTKLRVPGHFWPLSLRNWRTVIPLNSNGGCAHTYLDIRCYKLTHIMHANNSHIDLCIVGSINMLTEVVMLNPVYQNGGIAYITIRSGSMEDGGPGARRSKRTVLSWSSTTTTRSTGEIRAEPSEHLR